MPACNQKCIIRRPSRGNNIVLAGFLNQIFQSRQNNRVIIYKSNTTFSHYKTPPSQNP